MIAPNIVPRIGVLAPEGARTAIRELFLSHVIGGKHLSSRDDFLAMVQGATPDVVLTGVELLAEVAGDTVVVDVGGATTDVHSVVELDPEDAGLSREVVATTRVTRTVEGDLGMRWSAVTTAEAAGREDLAEAAVRRRADVGFVPEDDAERELDEQIAREAVGLALRRHAGRSKVVVEPGGPRRGAHRQGPARGRPARRLRWRAAPRPTRCRRRASSPAASARSTAAGSCLVAREVTVDEQYVLAAAGLLASEHGDAARRLVGGLAAHALG